MAAKKFFLPFKVAAKPTGIGAPGAKLYVYAKDTTTLRTVYATSALSSGATRSNPVIADGAGQFPDFYLNDALLYDIMVTDKLGSVIYPKQQYIPGTAPDAASLEPYASAAAGSATAAATSATAAATSATAAASSATSAGTSATSAAGALATITAFNSTASASADDAAVSAAEAASSAATAEAAEDGILDALAEVDLENATVNVANRTLLAALDTALPAYLTEAGREGQFVYRAGDYSAEVAVDTEQGAYVAPSSDTDGSTGAWLRVGNVWTPAMFGAQDATGTMLGADEVVYDCSPALAAMWALAKIIDRQVTLDFSGRGWGVTETFEMDTETAEGSAWWNSRTFNLIGGRFVAMSQVDAIIRATGKIFRTISGAWRVQGGLDSEVSGGYVDFLAKDGLVYNDSAGSFFGDVHGLNLRGYALRSDTDGNSIPVGFREAKAAGCGSRGVSSDLGWGGNYTAGVYDNSTGDGTHAGYAGSDLQRMTITVELPAGVDPNDVSINQFGIANDDEICLIQEIVDIDGQNVTLRVFPWLSATTGSFYSCHGGAFDLEGINTANTYFSLIYGLNCGTTFRCHPTYAPSGGTVLSEGSAIGIGLGNHQGSMLGLETHAHLENNVFSIAAATFTGMAHIKAISYIEPETIASVRHQYYNGTVFEAASKLLTIPGVRLEDPNGLVMGGSRELIPTDKNGTNTLLVYHNNSVMPSMPAYVSGGRTVYLYANQFNARRGGQRLVTMGPFYGPGLNDAPTGTISVALSSDGQNNAVTLDGDAGPSTFTSASGAFCIDAVFEPTETGTGGNWKTMQRFVGAMAGYSAGAGGTVTQATSKSTGVTLNKSTGKITMHNAALAAGTPVSFTLTNSAIEAADILVVNIGGGATANSYIVNVTDIAAGSARIQLHNISAGSLGEAVELHFAVIKGAVA